jgi:hypothetical protein
MTMLDDNFKTSSELSLSPVLKNHISNMAYWSRFIGMIGMVMCGLFLLMLLLGGSFFMTKLGSMNPSAGMDGAGFPAAFLTLYIGFMVIMFTLGGYLSFLLYNYGRKAKFGLEQDDQGSLELGFNSIRRLFKIYGIFMVVILSF